MTLVDPAKGTRHDRGSSIARVGMIGLVGAIVITVVAWLLTDEVFGRFGESLEVTGEALLTVGDTLEVADDTLATLTESLDTAAAATGHAAASSLTVADAVSETVVIVGEDLPASIEAIRNAMPALIEASNVIDNTLSGLSLLGIPYSPAVPLDEAFSELDRQLAPLPAGLRDNADIIANLIPEADGFYEETVILTEQIELIRLSVDEARSNIDAYRSQAARLDSVVRQTAADFDRSALLAHFLVVLGGGLAAIAMFGLVLTGRAITGLEQPR